GPHGAAGGGVDVGARAFLHPPDAFEGFVGVAGVGGNVDVVGGERFVEQRHDFAGADVGGGVLGGDPTADVAHRRPETRGNPEHPREQLFHLRVPKGRV